MKTYISLFLTILIFFSFAIPASNKSTIKLPSLEEQIESKRADNIVLLRYLDFKIKYGSHEEYYRQVDSILSK